jgi:hypothetical protein
MDIISKARQVRLLAMFALVGISAAVIPAPIGSSGDDGAVGGECQSRYDTSGADNLVCAAACATGCSVESSTQTIDGVVITHKYCKCSGSDEPECCHLYIEFSGGVYVGPAVSGICGGEDCNGGQGTCTKKSLAVPVGEPPRYKAVCK